MDQAYVFCEPLPLLLLPDSSGIVSVIFLSVACLEKGVFDWAGVMGLAGLMAAFCA